MSTSTSTAIVKPALSTDEDLLSSPEHCALSSLTLDALGASIGDQIRVVKDGEPALFTIAHVLDDQGAVRMSKRARARFDGGDVSGSVVLTTEIVRRDIGDEDALRLGEFVERLSDGGENRLIALAPHGGSIEVMTDKQAELIYATVPGSVAWRCRGYRTGGGAHRHWHVTGADLSPRSFPMFGALYGARKFKFAVSFHGYDGGSDVRVGGAAPRATLDAIAKALSVRSIPARVDTTGGLGGSSPGNIVNRVTVDGRSGVQIEQPIGVRMADWQKVVEGVLSVLVPAPSSGPPTKPQTPSSRRMAAVKVPGRDGEGQ